MSGDEHNGRAKMPADINAPDTIVWGFTFRQLAVLAVAGVAGFALYRGVGHLLAPQVLVAVAIPLVAAVVALVAGRRDGLPLDAWLLAAVRHSRGPHRLVPAPGGHVDAVSPLLRVVDQTGRGGLGPLRLPVSAVDDAGVLSLPGKSTAVAVVAAGTVNLALRTDAEQAALLTGFGRWLNSLTAPAQIVVSARPMDLAGQITAVRQQAALLGCDALRRAATDYADFLADLATTGDPLRRSVLILTHAEAGQTRRRGEDTAAAMTALGAHAELLDGVAVTAALASAVDPYNPPVPGPRAVPESVITATHSWSTP